VPDGFDELAGKLDPRNLRPALAAEALLGSFVAEPIGRMSGGVGGRLDERPAEVPGTVFGERPPDVAVARLTDERTQAGVPGQLLRTGEGGDVADLRRDRAGPAGDNPWMLRCL